MSKILSERYDEQLLLLFEKVRSEISRVNTGPSGSTSDTSNIIQLLSQCEDLIKQMNVEARLVEDHVAKKELLQKVTIWKTQLVNLREDFLATKKPTLMGATEGSTINLHRDSLRKTNEHLSKQNETLERARRVMAETEDVAMEITSELERNREKIEISHQRVADVSGLTNQARRIIQSMQKRWF
mmetsp:Transcript_14929/g.21308  ORF Transcript_14929/g.21308 Transcript_14929/m.21308 type:complete len:185 (+) Transcript_14929:1869-2423(+)|eukprot:CAMPEP_0172427686 /NCGR_PEP_ID=MMETSP1064-20121228/43035_1 /TAXON_ID=202472 /ORGANISM="Aulacoseira subarctica , Strain CCAP 1002/5" /LENGTH=184 /DNA_ID=CAMNT_0013172009 /DNA_START=55 /DNA_END=609 /DNA_ORIENTATION=+